MLPYRLVESVMGVDEIAKIVDDSFSSEVPNVLLIESF
jgi:hypothetical protein